LRAKAAAEIDTGVRYSGRWKVRGCELESAAAIIAITIAITATFLNLQVNINFKSGFLIEARVYVTEVARRDGVLPWW
jgi:hypothetical protein